MDFRKTKMQTEIPNAEVEGLLCDIKGQMEALGFSRDTIERTRLVVIHPKDWEVSLLVPYKDTQAKETRRKIESILFGKCSVEQNCCDYFGKQKPKEAYEWYFRHPNVPRDIYDRIELEIEEKLGSEIGMGLPYPSGIKSTSDTAFITLKEEFFDAIARGEKKEEYRNLNQYYCDKFFSPGVKKKYLKINRGYKAGKENQMVFEIKAINIVSEDGREIPALDKNGKLITSFSKIPNYFAPAAYGIVLGERKI